MQNETVTIQQQAGTPGASNTELTTMHFGGGGGTQYAAGGGASAGAGGSGGAGGSAGGGGGGHTTDGQAGTGGFGSIGGQAVSPEVSEIIARITYALTEIDNKKSKMKVNKELIDEMLKNDPAYAQVLETFETEKTALKKEKDAILASPEAAEYLEVQDKLRQEIKDLQDTLSPALEVLYQKTKSTNFVDANGKKRRILKKFSIAPGQTKMF